MLVRAVPLGFVALPRLTEVPLISQQGQEEPERRPGFGTGRWTQPEARAEAFATPHASGRALQRGAALRLGTQAAFSRVTRLIRLLYSQICSHADTAGLLSLSRTCQSLRATLVGPQSTPLWRSDRERRKLPLPSDMTERQFADLLHGSTCFVGDPAH